VPHPFAQFAKGWESKNLRWGHPATPKSPASPPGFFRLVQHELALQFTLMDSVPLNLGGLKHRISQILPPMLHTTIQMDRTLIAAAIAAGKQLETT
jgi:hypothetical protein